MLETLVRQLNMVRLSAGALAMIALLGGVGCTGLIDDGSEGLSAEEALARRMFIEKASPVLSTTCVSCHNGSRPGVGFLVGAGDLELRATLIAFDPPVINLTAPQSSRILTKGVHDGPALTAIETSDVLEWIRAEKDAQPDPGETDPTANLETAQFTPVICTSGTPPAPTCPTNDVDLTDVGLPGAKIHFVAQALGSGLYLNQLSLIAATDGAYLEHPLFVSHPEGAEPLPDTIDRFFNVKMNLMANLDEQIAGGTAAFVGFVATDKISIHFKSIKAFQPETGPDPGTGGPGGCKDLTSFKANAAPRFAASCLSCHGGQNNNATSAMNITGVNSADDAVVQLACNQALSRANTTTPETSGVLLAADPANANHPFRFPDAGTFAAFRDPVLVWINAEKVAP